MKANGFFLIISLHHNENARSGNLSLSFCTLGIIDSITAITSTVLPTSNFNGSNPLDKICLSSDVEVKTSSICAHSFSVGDHRVIVI